MIEQLERIQSTVLSTLARVEIAEEAIKCARRKYKSKSSEEK